MALRNTFVMHTHTHKHFLWVSTCENRCEICLYKA